MDTNLCIDVVDEHAPASRRLFLKLATAFCGTVAGIVLSVPLIGYFFGLRKRREMWVDLGAVADYPLGETRRVTFDNPLRQPWDGMTALTIVYVRYQGPDDAQAERFLVFSANCAHLGCPVSWFPQSGLFMCPCHGGVYYANGERAAGPPPRGLYHCVWRVNDGRLQIQAPHYPTLQDPLVPEHTTTA
jgi:menaquinol-cytochrome c reductase iron-sulfur subunit